MTWKLVQKLLGIVLMIVAPLVAIKAGYEWIQVEFMHAKPSYPFGKQVMKALSSMKEVEMLAGYSKQMLTIALVFTAISVLSYVAMLVKAMIRLVWLALVLGLGYFLYVGLR